MKTIQQIVDAPSAVTSVARSLPAPFGYEGQITVTSQLSKCGGNELAHFSTTAEIATERERRKNDCQAFGCLHDEILAAWPEVAPLIALHLSDFDGVPMHAVANGFYWLAGNAPHHFGVRYHGGNDRTAEECKQICMEYLRISEDEFAAILNDTLQCWHDLESATSAELVFSIAVDALRPRWKAEAEAGLALIRKLASE